MLNIIYKILLLLIITAGFITAQDDLRWNIEGEMPYPVSGGKAVVHNSKIHIVGGYSDSLQANVNWIQAYDPINKTWEITGSLSEVRYGLQAGVYNNNLYIYGGINEVNEKSFELEVWDFVSASTTMFDRHDFFDRVFSSGVINNNKLLIFGGYPGSRGASAEMPYIVQYDLSLKQMDTLNDTLFPPNELPLQQMSVKFSNRLFLIGGVYNGILQTIDVFDLTTHQFTIDTSLAINPRAAGKAVYHGGTESIYVIGAYNETEPAVASVEVLSNLYQDDFYIEPGPSLNYARKNLMAVEFDGKIYAFGGENSQGEVVPFIEVLTESVTSNEDIDRSVNKAFQLNQNYPNPFNPSTTISFLMNKSSQVSLDIYNTLGEHITNLKEGYLTPGTYEVAWNGKDSNNRDLSTGVYIYRLRANNLLLTKKMIYVK